MNKIFNYKFELTKELNDKEKKEITKNFEKLDSKDKISIQIIKDKNILLYTSEKDYVNGRGLKKLDELHSHINKQLAMKTKYQGYNNNANTKTIERNEYYAPFLPGF